MKSIILPAFLFCCLFVNAQADTKTEKSKERFKSIKMLKYPNVDKFETAMAISDIQIIPDVRDSIRLGYSTNGMFGGVVTLKPDKPLSTFLQDHVYKMYKNQFKKNGSKILFLIKELRVSDRQSVELYAYTRFEADAYISENGERYKKLYSVDTVFIAALGIDVAGGHPETIEKAIKFLLKQTLKCAETYKEEKAEEQTINEILNDSKQRFNIPILTEQVYKDGLYRSFEEFLNNRPSVVDYETSADEKGRVTIRNTVNDTFSVWGICRQGEIYKYYDRHLFPIEKQGNGFILSDYVDKTNRINANRAKAALIGGSIGGVLGGLYYYSEVSKGEMLPLLVNTYPYIDQLEKQPVASIIDMKTGTFAF